MSEQAKCNLEIVVQKNLSEEVTLELKPEKRRSQECKERGGYPKWREKPEQKPRGRK